MRKVPIAPDVDASVIARGCPGFSGADLANIVNEAALFAARGSKRLVDMEDFEKAKDKIIMGAERKSMVMPEEERRNTAYHESGHAIVARLLPGTDPVHKVTIIPRGRALGVTVQLPEQDRYSYNRDFLLNNIAVLFGGRIAEELFMNQMTTGASNDFKRATEMARRMVTEWGMSDILGPMTYSENEGEVFLGRSVTTHQAISDETMQKVDKEIRRIIDEQYHLARKLLEENRDKVEAMTKALLEWETLDADQIKRHHGRQAAARAQAGGGQAQPRRRATAAPRARSRRRTRRRRNRPDARRGPASGAAAAAPFRFMTAVLRCGAFELALDRPRVMGILNVTADSFSDGGRFLAQDRAIAHGLALAADGADLVDVGGESTRPGAEPVPLEVELARVMPVVRALVREGVAVSVDTMKPEVMRQAIDAGCAMVNDVNAFRAEGADRRGGGAPASGCAPCTCRERPRRCRPIRATTTWWPRSATTSSRAARALEAAGVAREPHRARPRVRLRQELRAQRGAARGPARARGRRLPGGGRALAQAHDRRDHRPPRRGTASPAALPRPCSRFRMARRSCACTT